MYNKKNRIIPYRIKQARISRGMSIGDLAISVSVSKQDISQYELGKDKPSKAVLNAIADALEYPTSFFYKPLPMNENASSAIFFRSKKTTKIKSLNIAREKIEIFREINDYLEQFVDFPMLRLPKIEYDGDETQLPINNDLIESYAMVLREYWGLGTEPIENLTSVVQKNGIRIAKMELHLDKLDAFSGWFNRTPFIFLNSDKNTNARIRFSIACQLGHLLMHADYYTEEDLKDKKIANKLADEANRFAGAFLLPRESFSKDVFSTSLYHFIQLKGKWKTSIAAMIYRCNDLWILSENETRYLKDQMTTRRYWNMEPFDKEIPVEKPFAHEQAIQLLLEHGIVTPGQLVEEIGCYAEELEHYCSLEKGILTGKRNSNIIVLKPRV